MTFRWLSLLVCVGTAVAQPPKIGGDYSGMLSTLHLKLHLKVAASGAVEGTLDSLDQGATDLPCANFHLAEKAFSFDVPSVGGSWHGTVSGDGDCLRQRAVQSGSAIVRDFGGTRTLVGDPFREWK